MGLQTRRTVLRGAIATSFFLGQNRGDSCSKWNILCEPTYLSQESAEGFRRVLTHQPERRDSGNRDVLILPAASAVTLDLAIELRQRCLRGAWVVWEMSPRHKTREAFNSQRKLLYGQFGISTGELVLLDEGGAHAGGMYVRYLWPGIMLARTFLAYLPVASDEGVIAYHSDHPVATVRQVGRGGIVFLGSMLGPNIYGEDREAKHLVLNILRAL